ncbi:MAG: hypothetical protein MRJ67_01545 [Nitrospirales bacterium]|nr:hypothetical protein [Nitrospirales bacterium]
MNEDELEIAILEKYIKQFELAGENNPNKCARELDMREVLRDIVGDKDQNLESSANIWHNRLAPRNPGKSLGVLRPCSDSTIMNTIHKYHARAFTDPINNQPAPAWDRIRELKAHQEKSGSCFNLIPISMALE